MSVLAKYLTYHSTLYTMQYLAEHADDAAQVTGRLQLDYQTVAY